MWMLGMVWDFFAVLLHASAAAACRHHGAYAFTGQNVGPWLQAEIAQLVARRSHHPKVVSAILTFRMLYVDAIDVDRAQLPADTRASTSAHSNSARAMRRAHYAESRMLTACSPRLWSTMPHIMAATVAHHAGGQRFNLAWVPAMVSAHSRCRACVW